MATGTGILFSTLADPTRRALYQRLVREGGLTVRVLTDRAGGSQPAGSKHLRLLKSARLVRRRRDGRETHYRAQPRNLAPLIDWMSVYGAFWHGRLDDLEAL